MTTEPDATETLFGGSLPIRTREQHLQWCKDRALEYWRVGDLVNAVASMASDLEKREQTKCNPYLLMVAAMYATQHDHEGVKRWIEGFR